MTPNAAAHAMRAVAAARRAASPREREDNAIVRMHSCSTLFDPDVIGSRYRQRLNQIQASLSGTLPSM